MIVKIKIQNKSINSIDKIKLIIYSENKNKKEIHNLHLNKMSKHLVKIVIDHLKEQGHVYSLINKLLNSQIMMIINKIIVINNKNKQNN